MVWVKRASEIVGFGGVFVRQMKALLWLVPSILPIVTWWVSRHERQILSLGVPLAEPRLSDSVAAGVNHPERIRLLYVDDVPLPVGPTLQRLGRGFGLSGAFPAAMTLNYGIYVRKDCASSRRLLVHEFAHVSQYERLGGVRSFLDLYLRECARYGYRDSPLEQEARAKAEEISDGASTSRECDFLSSDTPPK